MNGSFRRALWLAALASLYPAGRAAAEWIVTELPVLPGWSGDVQPSDINSSGVIVGVGNYISGVSATAFRYEAGTMTELPYLAPGASYPFANATAINRSGVIAGQSHNIDSVDRAVIWSGSTVQMIPEPPDTLATGDMRANGLNNAGVVVGYYVSTDGYAAAYYYDGQTHSLKSALRAAGLTGERSYAEDVNNNGLICGHAEDPASEYNFFTYDINTGTVNVLGVMTIWESYFTAGINDAGQVIGRGRSYLGSPIHALRYDGGFQILDPTITEAQWAADIAADGRVIGNTDTSADRWMWFCDTPGAGEMRHVTLAGWSSASLSGINDAHIMVGYGLNDVSPDDDRGFIAAPPPGDIDHDGDVDLDDYTAFVPCLSGPKEGEGFSTPPASCLAVFDFAPADGDVDLHDFAALAALMEPAGP